MSNTTGTDRGALGVGARLNKHDARLSDLNKKYNKLEQKMNSGLADLDLELIDRTLTICLDNEEIITGKVLAVGRFRLKLMIKEGGRHLERIFYRSRIRWQQEENE